MLNSDGFQWDRIVAPLDNFYLVLKAAVANYLIMCQVHKMDDNHLKVSTVATLEIIRLTLNNMDWPKVKEISYRCTGVVCNTKSDVANKLEFWKFKASLFALILKAFQRHLALLTPDEFSREISAEFYEIK